MSSRGKVGAVSSSSSAFSHNQSDAFSSDAGDSLLSGFSFDESSTFTMRDEKTTSCYDKEQSYNGGWKAGTLIDFERSLRDKINYCAEENVPLSSEEVDTLLAYGTWLMTSGQYDLVNLLKHIICISSIHSN